MYLIWFLSACLIIVQPGSSLFLSAVAPLKRVSQEGNDKRTTTVKSSCPQPCFGFSFTLMYLLDRSFLLISDFF